jgi:hypothetical protein
LLFRRKSAEHFSEKQHFMLKSQLADAREAAKVLVNSMRSQSITKNKKNKNNEMFIARWRTGTRDV